VSILGHLFSVAFHQFRVALALSMAVPMSALVADQPAGGALPEPVLAVRMPTHLSFGCSGSNSVVKPSGPAFPALIENTQNALRLPPW
jgi:hypothetical protein